MMCGPLPLSQPQLTAATACRRHLSPPLVACRRRQSTASPPIRVRSLQEAFKEYCKRVEAELAENEVRHSPSRQPNSQTPMLPPPASLPVSQPATAAAASLPVCQPACLLLPPLPA